MNMIRSQILSIVKPYRRIARAFNASRADVDAWSRLAVPARYTREETTQDNHWWSTHNRLTVAELKNILEGYDDDCELECSVTEDYDGYQDGYSLRIVKIAKETDEQYITTLYRDIDVLKGQAERTKTAISLDEKLDKEARRAQQAKCDYVINDCLDVLRELQLGTNENISSNMESLLNGYIEMKFGKE